MVWWSSVSRPLAVRGYDTLRSCDRFGVAAASCSDSRGLAPVSVDRSSIRVKAMIIAPNDVRTAHAVSVHAPTRENPDGFHRLFGGSVELSERHVDTIRREVREELGADVHDLALLTVVENIFRIDGVLGHEIVFLYSGRLDPPPPATGATLIEDDGTRVPVVWRPLNDQDEQVPLYPSDVGSWVGK